MSGHFFNLHIDIAPELGQPRYSETVRYRETALAPVTPHPVLIRLRVFMQRLKLSLGQTLVARLYNCFTAWSSYSDLSPDLAMRRRVNSQVLASRPAHSGQEWYQKFWAAQGISREVAGFVYQALAKYAGLRSAQVLPHDRLCEDLKLPLISWFDWELALYEDFAQEFNLELEDYLDISQLKTVADLMGFLNQQVAVA
ncbi:MAG: hypothetical protein RLZZ511_2921 [Cyanobacteriota bacterium]|jgi:hypothetical protein